VRSVDAFSWRSLKKATLVAVAEFMPAAWSLRQTRHLPRSAETWPLSHEAPHAATLRCGRGKHRGAACASGASLHLYCVEEEDPASRNPSYDARDTKSAGPAGARAPLTRPRSPGRRGCAASDSSRAGRPTGLQCRSPGGVPERPKGTGCKPVGSAFGGSNPPAPIFRCAYYNDSPAQARLLRYRSLTIQAEITVWLGRGSSLFSPAMQANAV
jgi:hypothetical protein